MASACVNNIGMSTDKSPATYPSYGWLSPQISFSRELADNESSKVARAKMPNLLEDPVTMLPADELFSDGKLVPLQRSTVPQARSPDAPKARRRLDVSSTDPYLYSPKAPRCSSRWKEILGLGLTRFHLNNNAKPDSRKTTQIRSPFHYPLAYLSLPLPLPPVTITMISPGSRSIRISLISVITQSLSPRTRIRTLPPPRVKVVKHRANSSDNPTGARIGGSSLRSAPDSTTTTARGVSVDSPRMNSSGKIVFQGLERSSSSPSSFNGGPRFKHRGMERSYSANVRVTPVLNVPVCSLRGSSKSSVFGFQIFSSTQKREGVAGNGIGNRGQQISNSKNRTDRA
ncbi:hypothetical protein Acr_00g0074070 [Actinidia rufa]|uniref:Uncharacterized protein n=1 Tax=Actinidia rufa TaxID=165716 RepID=A0A7J0DSF7_9ERIC|nr:hypothetical protein Acr_00g0074070 [Actinidia rufa]